MTNEEAKFILSAYRPNGRDASDPSMAEALEQAARDPELAAWFQAERSFDEIISAKLNEVSVPPELKPTILAGHRVMGDSAGPSRFFHGLRWAAAFLICAGALMWLNLGDKKPASPLARFRADMTAHLASRTAPLDFRAKSLPEVRQWLGQEHAIAELEVPQRLAAQGTMGCQILEWNGAKVTLVCFDIGDWEMAHLLVVDRRAFSSLPDSAEPTLNQSAGWTTASWVKGDRVYLLAGQGERPELRNFL